MTPKTRNGEDDRIIATAFPITAKAVYEKLSSIEGKQWEMKGKIDIMELRLAQMDENGSRGITKFEAELVDNRKRIEALERLSYSAEQVRTALQSVEQFKRQLDTQRWGIILSVMTSVAILAFQILKSMGH